MEFEFFEDLTTILTAALVVAIVFSRIRLPSIIAYMIAGVLIGPYLLGWVDPSGFALMAEFGVVFLLFSLGLEFSLPRMMSLKGPVFGLGGAQVLVTTTVFASVVYAWGATIEAAVVVAGALALSSTAIVTRELAVSQQLDSRYAQLSVAVLLFQDLVAIVFLILVPVFARGEGGNVAGELGSALLRGALLLVLLMSIGKWLLPRIYHEVSRTRSDEVFLLTTLVIALLAAWLTHSVGLSMALGSFIIGMMLGEGPFRHKIDVEIRPFKDVLLGLFFVTIGMNVDLAIVADHWLRIVLFTAALVLINISILAVLARTMGERHGDALKVGITLAQAGEFGLALLVVAQLNAVVPIGQASFVIAIAVLSMLVSPLLIRHVHTISDWLVAYWPGASVHPPEV
ncbi:MAG: CPA2 family monovalent cation:H+ antiporter-2, partial [Gammaproteobacteria bacterium]